jgi:putative Mn2+ efflux pump MntP
MLLFGLATNTDDLAVGVAYGMKWRSIRWKQNLPIAAVTTMITLVALGVGRKVRAVWSTDLHDTVGSSLLISLCAKPQSGAAPISVIDPRPL